jgi:hypothetical protein
MKRDSDTPGTPMLSTKLFWTGVITLIVGVKLIVTFFAPSLRAPGELPLSGFLLLVCTAQLFQLHFSLKKGKTSTSQEKESR